MTISAGNAELRVRSAAIGTITLLAWATFAFGGVYPWAWKPLLVGAAAIGALGAISGRRSSRQLAPVLAAWCAALAAILLQVIPLPRPLLERLSPSTVDVLSRYDLSFTWTNHAHSLSIEPMLTIRAFLFATVFGWFVYGLDRSLSRATLFTLARWILILGVVLSLVGIVQRSLPQTPLYGFWLPVGGLDNAFGPFVNRNHFAGWMVMTIALGLGYLRGLVTTSSTLEKSGWRERLLWFGEPAGTRIVLTTMALGIMSISVVWSLSRSGICSLVAVFALFALLVFRGRHKRIRDGIVVAISILILLSATAWKGLDTVAAKFATLDSTQSRWAAWQDTAVIIQDFLTAGTGMNTYTVATLFYQTSNAGFHLAEAHNDYLQLLSDGGLLVFLPVIAAAFTLVRAFRKRLGDVHTDLRTHCLQTGAAVALVGIAIQEMVEFSLQKPANAFLFSILLTVGLYEPGRRSS